MEVIVGSLHRIHRLYTTSSVLGWSATARLTLVVPALTLLWLAVWWANLEVAPL
jgi:hypothetical protein